MIWSENRAEWIAVLWGCILEGVVAVPVDYRSPAAFVLRVADIVDAKAIVVGDTVQAPVTTRLVWSIPFDDPPAADDSSAPVTPAVPLTPTSIAEIIFTSGATADPKGVVLTHKNILANVVPIEKEIGKYRKYLKPFAPIRFLNLLPLSHMFGQALATFIPPILPGVVVFSRSLAPADIVRQIHDRRVSVVVCVPKVLEVLRDYVIATGAGRDSSRGRLCTRCVAGGATAPSIAGSASSSGRSSSAPRRSILSSRHSGEAWGSQLSRVTG